MEKAAKSKNRVWKFLTGAASAVSFQNPPFSPTRDKRLSHAVAKGFSGPVVSLVPHEARRKNKKVDAGDSQEPNSPKVSCMGQIKQRKKCQKAKHSKPAAIWSPRAVKTQGVVIPRIFGGAGKTGAAESGNHDGNIKNKQPVVDRAPSLEKLKRFSSRRDTLANFEWTAQIIPVESDHRDYYSDEDVEGSGEEEVIIPFWPPDSADGEGMILQARKEVNLWKRRTIAPPIPLLLH